MSDKIVEMKRADEKAGQWPIELEEHNMNACEHHIAHVDERARTLTCKACGVPVDPIEFVARLAKFDRKTHWERERLETLHRELMVHAFNYVVRRDGSECLTLCGATGEIINVSRRRLRISCKRCNKKLHDTRGPLTSMTDHI